VCHVLKLSSGILNICFQSLRLLHSQFLLPIRRADRGIIAVFSQENSANEGRQQHTTAFRIARRAHAYPRCKGHYLRSHPAWQTARRPGCGAAHAQGFCQSLLVRTPQQSVLKNIPFSRYVHTMTPACVVYSNDPAASGGKLWTHIAEVVPVPPSACAGSQQVGITFLPRAFRSDVITDEMLDGSEASISGWESYKSLNANNVHRARILPFISVDTLTCALNIAKPKTEESRSEAVVVTKYPYIFSPDAHKNDLLFTDPTQIEGVERAYWIHDSDVACRPQHPRFLYSIDSCRVRSTLNWYTREFTCAYFECRCASAYVFYRVSTTDGEHCPILQMRFV